MSDLSNVLQDLLDFLGRRGLAPPTRDIRLIEIGLDTPNDKGGRPRVKRSALLQPSEYEHRFSELMGSGLPWINVSCYGVDDDKLIVGIEAAKPTAKATLRTSVNYAGPSAAVLAHAWSVDESLAIE
jgi:hypothetical protein